MTTSTHDIESLVRVNLLGSMLWARTVCAAMVRQRSGVIINVGSVLGSSGGAGVAAYSAAKSGLIGVLTRPRVRVAGTVVIVCLCVTGRDANAVHLDLGQGLRSHWPGKLGPVECV
jgi:3-oxoacyl-[acyl-carrier protein] reductase